jgi:light-regulated signal transduction histidine kinase (bacteriophytochrome)
MSMNYDPRQVRHTSAPWSHEELAIAWRLRQMIMDLAVRR